MKKNPNPSCTLMLGKRDEKLFFDCQIPKRYFICIPKNENIQEFGYFHYDDFQGLLRKYCKSPKAIRFLADMM